MDINIRTFCSQLISQDGASLEVFPGLLAKRLDHPEIGKQINLHTGGPGPGAGAHYVQSLAAFITQLLIDSTVE